MHKVSPKVNDSVAQASQNIIDRDMADGDDLIRVLVLSSIGKKLFVRKDEIQSGDSTVKQALLDHQGASELLSPEAIDVIFYTVFGNYSTDEGKADKVLDLVWRFFKLTGLNSDFRELKLTVVAQKRASTSRSHIIITHDTE